MRTAARRWRVSPSAPNAQDTVAGSMPEDASTSMAFRSAANGISAGDATVSTGRTR